MTGQKWLTIAVVYVAVTNPSTTTSLLAGDEKSRQSLHLETAHFENAIVGTARTVGLKAKLDGKGGGNGTLTLDPNLKVGSSSSLGGLDFVDVTLKEVKADESAKKGRRLYKISGKGLKRLLVFVPTEGDGSCWLMMGSTKGSVDMVEMRVVAE